MPRFFPLLSLVFCAFLPLAAQGDDDAARLRDLLKDEHAVGADLWIYNNIGEAMEKAQKENKPIFVTFRCVPCKACAGFDAEVAKGSDRIERLAREKFVSVRQVEMEGVDLSLFQFDYDLNWAAMFINADGVVYARYGTQSAAGADAYNSIEGLEKTMQRVLELHAAYPKNKAELAGKRAAKKPYRTAMEMPGLHQRDKFNGPTTRQNCIHCHMIHDAENFTAQKSGQIDHNLLWRYPLPDNIGLVIDPRDGSRVKEVIKDSPAAMAGIAAGEEVERLNGQPITSIADMQWVLHHLPNTDTTVKVEGSRSGTKQLKLVKGWKKSDISWRGSMWSVSPKLRVWAPELDAAQRRKLGLPDDQTALQVRWINTGEPGGRAAQQSGLRNGDVIVALDDKPITMGPRKFNVHIKLNYQVGQELPITILRGGKKQQMKIKLVE